MGFCLPKTNKTGLIVILALVWYNYRRIWDAERKVEVLQNENEMLQKQLMEDNKELAWFKNNYVNNPTWDSQLHLAAYSDTEEVVMQLVQDGAYVNLRNKDGLTPITNAAIRNDKNVGLRIIKCLIENKADPFLSDKEHRTFLHHLVSTLSPAQFHDIAIYLVSKNLAKLCTTTGLKSQEVPLQYAVRSIEIEEPTLKALYESGVDFNVLDKDGDNLLCYALLGNRSTKLMYDLIKVGADWRHINNNGWNLLHIASEICYIDGVKYFMQLGLDVNATSFGGDTPLHRVMLFGKGNVLETTRVLIENRAGVEIKKWRGRTALEEAQERGDDMPDKDEVIRLLKGSG